MGHVDEVCPVIEDGHDSDYLKERWIVMDFG